MKIIIRDAEMGDLDAMVNLLMLLFAVETDFQINPRRHRQGLAMMLSGHRKHRCVKVAEVDDQVVGMGTAQSLISTAEGGEVTLVEDMVVDPNWRYCGIGRRLMDSIEIWAIDRGTRRMQLLADRTNFSALDFYDRIGWHPTQLICLRRKWNEK
jgi:GNAT superfamily N-acetyltransferase